MRTQPISEQSRARQLLGATFGINSDAAPANLLKERFYRLLAIRKISDGEAIGLTIAGTVHFGEIETDYAISLIDSKPDTQIWIKDRGVYYLIENRNASHGFWSTADKGTLHDANAWGAMSQLHTEQ